MVSDEKTVKSTAKNVLSELQVDQTGVDDSKSKYCGKCSYGWIIEKGRARRCFCNDKRTMQESIDSLLKRHRAGISTKLSRVNALSFLIRPGHEYIKPALDKYIKDLGQDKKRYGFFIFGKPGVGKSYAAAYIVNTVRNMRIMTAAMVNFSRTLSALRATFKDEFEHRQLLNVLFDTPLLAIDDIGMEQRVTENPELSWAVSKFYEIIDYRRDEELPTIITSNRTPEQLKDRLGEPIMARIDAMTMRLDIYKSE